MTTEPTAKDETAPPSDAEPPALADGVELIGKMEGSGFKEPPALVRRPDGQMLQLPDALFVVAQGLEAGKSYDDIAGELTAALQRQVSADDVRYLVDQNLVPLGVTDDGADQRQSAAIDPLLGLKLKTAVVPARLVGAVTTVLRPLFAWPLVAVFVTAFLGVCVWLLAIHGLAQSARQVLLQPSLLLLLLGMLVVSAAFHECGHATACRYGGAAPGAMGVGIYIVWPAFYTDVTDAYRLDRVGRLRTDLGGLYFNSIVVVAVAGLYAVTGYEPILLFIPIQVIEMVHQLLPFLRLDGYYVLADATGVPDMFGRIRPILSSLVPGHETDARADALKPWARAVVTAWVLVLIPVLILMFGLMAISAPRVMSTAWESLGRQWDALTGAWGDGDVPAAVWAIFQAAVLALPVAGMIASFGRLGTRAATAGWRATEGRLPARVALLGAAGALAIVAGTSLLGGDYSPIRPGERGAVADAATAFDRARHRAVSHRTADVKETSAQASSSGPASNPTSGGAVAGSAPPSSEDTTSSSSTSETPAPSAPTNLSAEATDSTTATLSWTAPPDADGIVLVRGDEGSCPADPSDGTQIGSTAVRTDQTDSTAQPGSTYCYAVFTLAADGTASSPATTQVTMPDTEPATSEPPAT